MSDLAPFVAATIRDKVVLELAEEQKKLCELREHYQRVQICDAKDHSVVYAEGSLCDAGRRAQATGLQLLTVPLSQSTQVPVRNLGKLRILVGGYHREYLGRMSIGTERFGVLQWDRVGKTPAETSKNVLVWNAQESAVLLFTIDGWPRNDWSRWIGRLPRKGLVRDLAKTVGTAFPEATVTFREVGLLWAREKQVIENIPDPSRTRVKQLFENPEGDDEDEQDPHEGDELAREDDAEQNAYENGEGDDQVDAGFHVVEALEED